MLTPHPGSTGPSFYFRVLSLGVPGGKAAVMSVPTDPKPTRGEHKRWVSEQPRFRLSA